jgi:hypothetical protein
MQPDLVVRCRVPERALVVVTDSVDLYSFFYLLPTKADVVEILSSLLNRLTETRCYAA